MIFLAHVETWDEFEKDFIQSRVVFAAEGYVDATEKLVYHFGNDMEAIHLLTAISDNNMIYIGMKIKMPLCAPSLNVVTVRI